MRRKGSSSRSRRCNPGASRRILGRLLVKDVMLYLDLESEELLNNRSNSRRKEMMCQAVQRATVGALRKYQCVVDFGLGCVENCSRVLFVMHFCGRGIRAPPQYQCVKRYRSNDDSRTQHADRAGDALCVCLSSNRGIGVMVD